MTAPTRTLAPPERPTRPYLGLEPYTENEQAIFFGRERDTALLVANVIAFDVTLMYGPSGVGKSSIVGAGVVPALHRRAATGRDAATGGDRIVPVALRSWRDDPRREVVRAMAQAAGALGHTVDAGAVAEGDDLWRQIALYAHTCDADLCLVFDQFEEYFLYHDDPDDPFARELAEAVARVEVPAHYLFSIREDALAMLDRLHERIPNLFDNIYRLEPLRVDEARRAIVGPIQELNRHAGEGEHVAIEPALIDAVLDQVRAGQVQIGTTGEGRVAEPTHRDEIELAHMQLVMDRLWNVERAESSQVLRLETLRRLGGADAIVRSHVDVSMTTLSEHDRDLVAGVFGQLVTPSGAKIAHRIDDLAAYAGAPAAELMPVLEYLTGEQRILRHVDRSVEQPGTLRYEIFHDALGPAVLEWRARREREAGERKAQAEVVEARAAARRERRRWMALVVVALVLVALLAATVVQSMRSQRETSRRQSEQLAGQAMTQLARDPTTAAETALDAWDERHTARAEQALRLVAPRLQVLRALSGHTDAVLDAEISPDGDTVLTTSDDHTARLWDAATGEPRHTLSGHTDRVSAGEFSEDGDVVLTHSFDGTARIWDTATGDPIAVLDADAGSIVDAALSPDARWAATVHDSGEAWLWDLELGEDGGSPLDLGDATATTLAFSPDSSLLVTGAGVEAGTGSVQVWSTATGRPTGAPLDALADGRTFAWVTGVSFDGTGDRIAIGDSIANMLVWRWREPLDESNPVSLWTDDVDDNSMDQVQFTPDGQNAVAVVGKFGYIFPIPTADQVEEQSWPGPIELGGHDDWAYDIAVSPDGAVVVTASGDGSAVVRDGHTGVFLAELRGHTGGLNAVDIGSDGRILTASADGTARIWQASATTVFRGHGDWVLDAEVTPDQEQIISASPDGTLRVWDVATQEEVAQLTDGDTDLGRLGRLTISADGRHVAAGNEFGEVWVWDLSEPGSPVARWAFNFGIFDLEFDASGGTLAIGSTDGIVHLWQWEGDEPLTRLPAGTSVASVAWSPVDDSLLATGASDGTVRLWEIGSPDPPARLPGHSDLVMDLAFAPDGRTLVSGSSDGSARVWDVESRTVLQTLRGQEGIVASVAFRDDGRQVVTGASDGTVAVWDVTSGKYLSFWRTHDDYINSVQILADGRILSAGDDNVIRLYPCAACRPIDEIVDDLRTRLANLPAPAQRGDHVGVARLPAGSCLPSTAGQDDLFSIEPVPCDEPHAEEVFGNLDLPVPADAPVPADLDDRAVAACTDRFFEAYVGIAADDSSYVVTALTPTDTAWDLGGRAVVCLLESPSRTDDTSARGAEG